MSGWAASRTISLSGQQAGRCPRGGPQGGTEVGLVRPRGGCRRPRRQGPPSQALWRLVSWEAESAPSSEQERVQGDREPGRTPLPAQALWSWVTQTPSTFPGTSLPSSARLLASRGLAPNSPLGKLQRGGEGSRPHRCAMPWGGGLWQHPPPLYFRRGKQVPAGSPAAQARGCAGGRLYLHVGSYLTCWGRRPRGWCWRRGEGLSVAGQLWGPNMG